MRIAIVGAGPAGLYFAILMKKADPSHDIVVFERNPAGATFGWGVVFSEETLGVLREADHQSHAEITDAFARWNTVDIRYRGRVMRSRGHLFSGLSRKVLLGILQRRAAMLGVELRFETEVTDVDGLAAGADLLVAADGANSMLRNSHRDQLGATLRPLGSKYAWFGSELVFDSFTFIFRETEHGLFQVHAYPYDADTSTFIVECPVEAWESAGLDRMSELESIAFCEELFAEDLAGHRLMSNRSLWLDFVEVRSESWHHGNLVLLGDSAHTVHFSIGSGTKLAMEDAIALAAALARHGQVEPALVDYELERQPLVERFQEAATQSAHYFEHVRQYSDLEPIQFGFNLLTRSGRISYAKLMIRDPQFVSVLDSWFSTAAIGAAPNDTMRIAPPPMFAPLRVGPITLRNRVVHSPAGEDADARGLPGAADAERLSTAAGAGPALVLTGPVAVSLEGRISPRTCTIDTDLHAAAWGEIVAAAHGEGALIGVQLMHAGRRGSTRPRSEGADLPLPGGGWELISASAIPYTPAGAAPREMTAADMETVSAQYAAAAERSAEAGFDVLELGFAHGYLVASFLSPLTNRREDEYGGALDNRLRFPLRVLDAVRAAWPEDRLLAVRMSASDWSPRGLSEEDAVAIARGFAEHGCQLLHVSAGQTTAEDRPDYRRGFLTALSDRIRAEAGMPTLVAGYVTTDDEVNTIVGAGRADLCIMDSPGSEVRDAVGV